MSIEDPLFTYQRDIEPGDLRKVWESFQEGVVDDAMEVTAGATGLTVDVAAGAAFVEGDTDPDQGLYRIFLEDPSNSSTWTIPIGAADGADPRLDLIVARVRDDFVDSSGAFDWRLEVIPGTPTTGATLINRSGAAALPDSCLHLADVLVPAAATELDAGDIADQRAQALAAIETVQANLDAFIATKNQPNGIPSLDSGGKIPSSQLPVEAMEYQGAWDASSNTPTLADGTGDTGDTYRVSAAGSQDLGSGSIDFEVGDAVVYNGSIWQRLAHVAASGGIATALIDAKGDLIAGTADDTVARLAVGTDGQILAADSGETPGLSWVDGPAKGETMGCVVHGASAGATRPSGYAAITWIGSVEPTNAVNDDIWVDTSG